VALPRRAHGDQSLTTNQPPTLSQRTTPGPSWTYV
jgi:hypothetical protein